MYINIYIVVALPIGSDLSHRLLNSSSSASRLLHMDSTLQPRSTTDAIVTVTVPLRFQTRPNSRHRRNRRRRQLLNIPTTPNDISIELPSSLDTNATSATEQLICPAFCCSIAAINYYMPDLMYVPCDCRAPF
jgi:hypothetical protein